MTSKTCTKCSRDLPLEDFHRDKRSSDGRHPRCKACRAADRAARYISNRDREREHHAAWYVENKATRACRIDGCNKLTHTRICSTHASRFYKHGDPHVVLPPRSGEDNPMWVGDDASYVGMHARVHRQRGKASDHTCTFCGGDARTWAYDHECPNEKWGEAGKYTVPYSTDLDHYIPLCSPCHSRFDHAHAKGRRKADARH
ncbi:hypothetical protein ACWDTG_25640 [Rhodococcus zopfii]